MIVNKKEIFTNKSCIILIAVLCTALWGNMIPAIIVGFDLLGINQNDAVSQILFAGVCFTISGLVVLSISSLKERKIVFPQKNVLKDTVILGVVQTSLQYILLYIGLPNTSAFNASIISSSGTFLIMILAHFVYKNDKMDFYKIIGCLLGGFGVLALNFNSLGSFESKFAFRGEGMIFLSTLTFVFMTPLCKKISKTESSAVFTGYSFAIGGILLIFIGLICGGTFNFSAKGIAMLIYLALASAVSGTLWNYLLEFNKVSKVSIYNSLVPLFGAISSSVMLGENILEIQNLFALLFTCVGIYCVERESRELVWCKGEKHDFRGSQQ